MCGIIAVLRRRSGRPVPHRTELLEQLDAAVAAGRDLGTLSVSADAAEAVDLALRGVPGVRAVLDDPGLGVEIEQRLDRLDEIIGRTETELDTGDLALTGSALEAVNATLIRLKDAVWAIRQDRLRTAREVKALDRKSVV